MANDVWVGYKVEATEVDFRLSRSMARELQRLIGSHGTSENINALGKKLADILDLPDTGR